jgi:hypothetical protein
MRISIEDAPSGQLIARRQSPRAAIPFAVISGILSFVPIIIFSTLLEPAQRLTCDRQLDRCQVELSTSGSPAPDIPISTLELARLETASSNPELYRVVLETTAGAIPLTQYFSSERPAQSIQVEQINRFLADPEAMTLTIRDEATAEAEWLIYALMAIVVGSNIIGILILSTSTTFTFDRLMGSWQILHKGLWGRRVRDFPISDIEQLELSKVRVKKGTSYRIMMHLRSKPQTIDLGSAFNYKAQEQIAQRIHKYLGLTSPLPVLADAPKVGNLQGWALLQMAVKGKTGREQAIQSCRQTLQLNPTDMATHQKLVMALMMQKRRDEARAHLIQIQEQFETQGLTSQAQEASQLLEVLDGLAGMIQKGS